MRSRFRATLSWNQVIRRRFGHQIAITERDVDRLVATAPGGDDTVELDVQRITLAVPAKLEQKAVAQRIQEADEIRRKFFGCKNGQSLAAAVKDARYEALGNRKAVSIPEPTRSLLLNAKDGEMLPPSVGQGGVELWAVCARTVVKADTEKRTAAQEELRQRELEVLAKRHLKDLRQDAHIEYR
jgi:peptidyl-prolyl cis-trans isomerase SurA